MRPSFIRSRRLPGLPAKTLQDRSQLHLEVERKFTPSSNFIEEINALLIRYNADTTSAGSRSWHTKAPLQFRDTYYDYDDQLSRHGLWIRYRTLQVSRLKGQQSGRPYGGEWNAKIQLGGDFLASSSEEVEGEMNVRQTLAEHFPNLRLESLEAMADLVTYRRTWELRDQARLPLILGQDEGKVCCFSIMLDHVELANAFENRPDAKFEHVVGEVEMTSASPSHMDTQYCSKAREPELESMHEYVQRFMANHPALFSPLKPEGKLVAYFAWKNRLSRCYDTTTLLDG